ncbi:hypothetical protein [Pseudomonas paeninsulae]|uniref:hypothetical protein n=1 Tax=Pseudomonas paeninsulae TaxID=3110772 RepID=UPI002D78E2A3|nr:hypothetical protein [Pseudomonas sp. IT1137]
MLARLAMLALAAAFLLMTGCAYHEYNDRSRDHYRGADRHHVIGHHKPSQHRYEEQKYQHNTHRQPDREARKRKHR